MAKEKVFWLSPTPKVCDTCPTDIVNIFYDAKTHMGPWACMCSHCFNFGPGLGKTGTGLGQRYELNKDGKWEKTEG